MSQPVSKGLQHDQSPCPSLLEVTNNLYEAVCAVDAEGVVVIWNTSAEKLYNLPATDILGKNIREFFPNALVEQVRQSRVPRDNVSHTPREGCNVLISSRPLYCNGRFSGAISSERDYADVIKLYTELGEAEQKVLFLENEIKKFSNQFGEIVGTCPTIRKRILIARQIAPADTSVMLTGESGTGKEVFARGIHEFSGRKGLFVPVNCSAIPNELFESEFFGYAPGAFTGASKGGKPGLFELASGGTIFLDEIGDMPVFFQSKLLRVLQEREVIRVGGVRPVRLDVRIISATNRPLKEMMQAGLFREDLFYRLNVVEIDLPPLRERKEDIPLLLYHFNKAFAEKNRQPAKPFSEAAIRALSNYEWPGNIRELMNVVENMVVTNQKKLLGKADIPPYIEATTKELGGGQPQYPLELGKAVKILERENILLALKKAEYVKSKAAALLQIPRSTLYYKAAEYGINLDRHSNSA